MPSNSSSPNADDKKRRRRSDYPFFLSYRTRWSDNDQYAHVNNAVYYHLFDAIVNTYLIQHCGLSPAGPTRTDSGTDSDGDQIGLVVSSFCEFFSPLSFPDVLDLGLRVARLGKSSVTYEVGVFKSLGGDGTSGSEDAPAAVGGYTHVFVDKHSRTSVAMHAQTRVGLEKLATVTHAKL
ncbi:HotDog domain-containing protein [Boletus edulis BED1]|uniref:HotDog domain-containing protein n=1 Tax=Boletus edulis BED1 TaxID=1328754 RepID=A0AAD4GLF2_BOLED|nr:HotDog domain-containing protein [Boletus edulis BED1]